MKLLAAVLAAALALQTYPPGFPREGITKLFENDRVIVWTGVFPKDKPTAMHEHKLPHVGVFLNSGRVKGTLLDGSSGVATVSKGSVTWGPAGRIHIEESLEEATRAIGIELKDVSTRAQSLLPPPAAKMVLENDRVVAWDLSWPAGAESPDHIHDYDYVIVPLDGGAVRYTGVDGASRIEVYTPGQAVYVKAGESHREVAARGAPRAIVVALK